MTPEIAIRTIREALSQTPSIRALFLSGSYGAGLEDAHSDIDFLLVAEDGASDAVAEQWREAVARTGEIVLWWDRTVRPLLINAITEDWLRTDVIVLKPDQLRGQTQDKLKVLFDHDGLYDALPAVVPEPPRNTSHILYQIEEFIRILGLMPLAMGREEYLNGVLGVFLLRNKLVELLVEETCAPHRGGALHLNRLITEEQKAVLTALPPAVPEREALIDAHLAYAEAYLPRARRLAADWGIDWPERFEAATWRRLRDTLGIDAPY